MLKKAGTVRQGHALDIVLASSIGIAAAVYALCGFGQLDFVHLASAYDTWFDADIRRIVGACEARWTLWHNRTNVHPLYALLVSLPCMGLRRAGFTQWGAAAAILSFSAFVFASTFYAVARVWRLGRVDAVLSTALMLSTSASMFWLSTPETYSLGASTMLLALVWLGVRRGAHDRFTAPLQSMLTFSITITNWMAGLLTALLALGLQRAIKVSLIAFVAVAVLSGAQKLIFPQAGLLFQFGEEQIYMLPTEREPIGTRLLSFFGQPLLAPETKLLKVHSGTVGVVMESAVPTTPSLFTWVAFAGWVVLLVIGGLTALQGRAPRTLVVFIFTVLASQVALHMLYGSGLFLYALHFTPFMVLIASMGSWSPWRKAVLSLTAITALATSAHNVPQFLSAAENLRMTSTDSYFVENFMK